jgi:hypothetical protein
VQAWCMMAIRVRGNFRCQYSAAAEMSLVQTERQSVQDSFPRTYYTACSATSDSPDLLVICARSLS